jgi:hypothetical protein
MSSTLARTRQAVKRAAEPGSSPGGQAARREGPWLDSHTLAETVVLRLSVFSRPGLHAHGVGSTALQQRLHKSFLGQQPALGPSRLITDWKSAAARGHKDGLITRAQAVFDPAEHRLASPSGCPGAEGSLGSLGIDSGRARERRRFHRPRAAGPRSGSTVWHAGGPPATKVLVPAISPNSLIPQASPKSPVT